MRRQLERQTDEKLQLSRQREMELGKNRDLQANVYDLEAKIRNREDQVSVVRKDLDDLKFSNNSMLDRNGDLKGEIEALQNHIGVLEQQNKDLNGEMEAFVNTDEQIRMTLNRKDRVNNLRSKVDYELKRSLGDLERSSPRRYK